MKVKGAIFALLGLFLIGFLTIMGIMYYTYFGVDKVLKDGFLYITTGSDITNQSDILFKEGFISDTSEYKKFAVSMKFSEKIYPGKYKLSKGMSYKELFRVIGTGSQTPVNVTFNNIRNAEKLAGQISKYIEADSLSILNSLKEDSLIKKYGFKPNTFLGMFIPDTYQFYWNTSAEQFLSRMNKEYEKFWSKDDRDAKREALGLSRDQVTTLASIVIEESKVADEMPDIAGVYLNRIKLGMPLQADPTVKFAVGDPTIKRVLYKHLEVDSPYNTYKVQGLPPGQICIPPIVAIDAVLNHKKSDYLYFCASADMSGRHVFAKNLSQHNVNAKAYAAALNKRGIK